MPCFRIYGKARSERAWRIIDVHAIRRRNLTSRWPLLGGSCTTWTSQIIAVGWDFAEWVLREQAYAPASRDNPVVVAGGRLRNLARRAAAGAPSFPSASEVLAHECGHTRQAHRLDALYLPVVGAVTLFREGRHWWNYFENDASDQGQFGGIVDGTVSPSLARQACLPGP